jgi:hypothetical protein
MSQFDFGTINAATKSGSGLASDLNSWRDALHSTHQGTTAPTYKVAGTPWLDNTSNPWALKVYDGTDWIVHGYFDTTTNVFTPGIFFKRGTAIASAATVDLSAATGNFVHVTGTTTITSLGTVGAGLVYYVTFDGILTLTHNGTSLILPGANSITTAAGDIGIFVSEGAGNWRCVAFTRAAYRPDDWEKISAQAFSGVAQVDITGLSAYRQIRITYWLLPATDGANVFLRYSTDNGSTFLAGAAEYNNFNTLNNGSTVTASTTSTTGIYLDGGNGLDNAATGGAGTINLYEFNQSKVVVFQGQVMTRNATSAGRFVQNGGDGTSATAKNALRLIASSGNINGHIVVEGVRG